MLIWKLLLKEINCALREGLGRDFGPVFAFPGLGKQASSLTEQGEGQMYQHRKIISSSFWTSLLNCYSHMQHYGTQYEGEAAQQKPRCQGQLLCGQAL